MTIRLPLVAVVALAASVAPAPATAQSLFNSAGIGLPLEALDGRARALANVGIGLNGASIMPTDPAALARLVIPTGVMASQPTWVDYAREGGEAGSFQGTRFPLMGLAYPVFSGMMSVQIGSFLDQHFVSEAIQTVDLGGDPFETTDRFVQDGSVSNLNIGYARLLGDDHAVGVTFGRYAGSVVRTLTRSYADQGLDVDDYIEQGKWSYTGHSISAGVSSDLAEVLRVAASVQIPTALDADASGLTDGGDGSYDLPMQFRVGATARLATGLLVTGSAVLADWSVTGDDLTDGAIAGSANGFGVGIELSRARVLGKEAPLRFGYRKTGLPFSFEGGRATERALTGGLGLALNRTEDLLLAGVDIGVERGTRRGGGVRETFWRATLSIIVSGS